VKADMIAQKFLVLFYCRDTDDLAVRVQVEKLTHIISLTHSSIHFCTANELVNRNRITSNPAKMLKEAGYRKLRAFRFFINKN
jgi:hypothetical protein